jgi:prolyl-tRNA synthetase
MITQFSKSFIHTLREDPKIAECVSHKFLLKGCFLTMISSGIYAYLPLGYKVIANINRVIRKYMDACGAQELFMSAVQPMEIWQKTGRDQDMREVMFRFSDRKERQLCLGPTHEEEITEIARRFIFSYKQMPAILYQIQTKFRDEPRPRFGLMRSCEFIMKDAYSFDKDNEGLAVNYKKMLGAYQNIFKECGLEAVMVEADSGAMGGSISHEFMVEAPIGEDILFYCPKDQTYQKNSGVCQKCGAAVSEKKMVELGHIFQLGTKYSSAQEGNFLDEQGKRRPFIMGCYGIGVSRILSTIAEVCSDEKGIIWPKGIGPFDITMVVLNKDILAEAFKIADELDQEGFSVLVDDRDEAAGVKFNDAGLIGSPFTVVMGKKYVQNKIIDIEKRKEGVSASLSADKLAGFFKDEYDR